MRASAGQVTEELLGNEECIEHLVQQLVHSRNGAFLVTGFRGVGKSTIVARALARLHAATDDVVLTVTLNVARPTTGTQLLFEIVRRLFEALQDSALLDRLRPETAAQIVLAYMRTSLSIKETRSQSVERSAGLQVGGDLPIGALLNSLAKLLPGVSAGRKSTTLLASEASFLAYSESDVEHDFLRITSLITQEALRPARRSWAGRIFRRGRRAESQRCRVVIVLDELDKLTAAAPDPDTFGTILSSVKNLLCIDGVHFVFVGGVDLHDRWLEDVHRGNSIFESVFGWHVYVPCLWDAAARVARDATGADGDDPLEPYLAFKGRGLPRRLVQAWNGMSRWQGDAPTVVPPPPASLRLYGRLQEIIDDFLYTEPTPGLLLDDDRRRLAAYYVIDWILRTDGRPFQVSEIVGRGEIAVFDPALRVSASRVDRLVAWLTENAFVEPIPRADERSAHIADVPETRATLYQLTGHVRAALAPSAVDAPWRRAATPRLDTPIETETTLPPFPAARPAALPAGATPIVMNRYELTRVIGTGGMGQVCEARDIRAGRDVAIKLLHQHLVQVEQARQRFLREGRLSLGLRHRNVVETLDLIDTPDFLAIVMELLVGHSLTQEMARARRVVPGEAVRIALGVLDGIAYLHAHGLFRLDIKPGNIMIRHDGSPVIIDLGIAKEGAPEGEEEIMMTRAGIFIGTPMYCAPEQLEGEEVDARADLYSLGLVLWQMLAGRPPRESVQLSRVLSEARQPVALDRLAGSAALHDVIRRATAVRPDDRYPTAVDMLAELVAVPEAVAGAPPVAPVPPGPVTVEVVRDTTARSASRQPLVFPTEGAEVDVRSPDPES